MISITTKAKQFYNFTTNDRETTRNEKKNMNVLIVSIDFMKTNMQSFNRNLKFFLQQKFVAIQH